MSAYPAGVYVVRIEVPDGHVLGHGELIERVRAAMTSAGVPVTRVGTRFVNAEQAHAGHPRPVVVQPPAPTRRMPDAVGFVGPLS